MQDTFDKLYKQSCNKIKFNNLMQFITNKNNILLAFRNIKKNKGSKTVGTDGLNIEFIENMGLDNYVSYIQSKFDNYTPKSVRRVEIPKPNGKKK